VVALLEERAMQDADPINPQRLFWELNEHSARGRDRLRGLRLGRELVRARRQARPIAHGVAVGDARDDGPGVPYAIAAKFCHPNRPAVALVGDGAMQMNGMAELITAQKYYKEWGRPAARRPRAQQPGSEPGDVGAARAAGGPMNPETQRIPDVRYGDFAELIGLSGVRVEQPEDISDTWRQAFAADRPFVIDAVCDPNVPPLPPHIRTDQARSLLKALRKGDPRHAVSSLSPSKRRSSSSCRSLGSRRFARTIPTDAPESDGTLEWDSTTIVVVACSPVTPSASGTPTRTTRPSV
jgi:pyruvate dehydrogenase (quinone)